MADKKISQLSNASTPLAGTETLPIVQSGSTVKVAVANLTAGRAVNCTGVNAFGESYLGGPDVNNALRVVKAGSVVYMQPSNGGVAGDLHLGNWYGNGFLQVLSTGNITFSTGNLTQGTAAKGINFTANTPASGMTSQLLNWYEEGTWTPTDGSGAGLSLSVASAIYRRVGTLVFVQIYVTYPTTANGSTAQIDGLPFTAEVGQNYSYLTGRNNTGTALVAQINANAKTMNFFNPLDVAQTNANLSGKFLILSGTYICA